MPEKARDPEKLSEEAEERGSRPRAPEVMRRLMGFGRNGNLGKSDGRDLS